MTTINIAGKCKARVLKALVNATGPLGMGRLQDPGRPMTVEDAKKVLYGEKADRDPGASQVAATLNGTFTNLKRLSLDYVWGRPIKVDFTDDEIDLCLYDRDAGEGAGVRAITAEFEND